jgi:hypothetical protein
MSTSDEPTKLRAGSCAIGRLIRLANDEYEEQFDESAAWRSLEARHAERQSRDARRRWVVSVSLAVAAACAILLKAQTRGESFAIVADPAVAEVPAQSASPIAIEASRQVPERAPNRDFRSINPAAQAKSNSLPLSSARAPLDCDVAIESGSAKDAATCLEQRASGDALSAQRALYELAVLKRSRLHDVVGALATLRTYRKRFPDGALKGEVDFALVEMLPKAGRAQEAIRESDALLQTPWGRTKTSELRLMRGRLAQEQLGDCEQALKEFGFIENEFGTIGDEATLRSAQCLERSGKRDLAEVMYRRYLARPGITQVRAVQERLQGFKSDAGT